MRSGVVLLALAVLVLLVAGAQAAHPPAETRQAATAIPAKAPPARSLASASGDDRRYALANGCYALRSGGVVGKAVGGYTVSAGLVGGAEAFRMQATAL